MALTKGIFTSNSNMWGTLQLFFDILNIQFWEVPKTLGEM